MTSITKQLANLNVNVGSALVAGQFCVTASGTNLSYSWSKDGSPAPYNANKPCYLVSSVAATDAGQYTVEVSGTGGKATSSATLSVTGVPIITKQLANLSVTAGGPLAAGQFCITATGSGVTYSWKKDGGTAPYNANKPCYLVSTIAASDAGSYTVTVSNSAGSVSSAAMLSVLTTPTFTKQLANLSVNAGSALVAGQFCVTASGADLTYTWTKNGAVAPYNANKPCYLVSSVAASDAGSYTVTATNSAGSVSSNATLSVVSSPVLTKQLTNLSVNVGSSLIAGQFCITASGSDITYSWSKDGATAPYNANKPCYLVTSLTANDAGTYTVSAKNSAGTAISTATLSIVSSPTITKQLSALSVPVGSALSAGQFCITANGSGLNYSWTKDGGTAPYNANKPCYLVPTLAASDAGTYTVTVTNSAGSATSTASLSIISPPALTKQLSNLTVDAGSSLVAGQFCIAASGTGISYSWTKDGTPASFNANKPCYLISSVTAADAGTYSVTAVNLAGSVTSKATLTVNGAPIITKPLAGLSVNAGSALTAGQFCVTASGTGISYSWKKDGAAAPYNANKPCYLISSVAASDAGSYAVSVTNTVGTVLSSATLTVVNEPVITKQPANLTVDTGGSLIAGQFCISASGTGLSYSWAKDGSPAPFNANKPCYLISSITSADAGNYVVTATNSAGSVNSSAVLTVNAAPVLTKQLSDFSANAGSALVAGQFCIAASGTGLTYSWTKDGKAAPYNASKPCYLVSSLALADSGTYTVTASNSLGTVSSSAKLVVSTPPPTVIPSISINQLKQTSSSCAVYQGYGQVEVKSDGIATGWVAEYRSKNQISACANYNLPNQWQVPEYFEFYFASGAIMQSSIYSYEHVWAGPVFRSPTYTSSDIYSSTINGELAVTTANWPTLQPEVFYNCTVNIPSGGSLTGPYCFKFDLGAFVKSGSLNGLQINSGRINLSGQISAPVH